MPSRCEPFCPPRCLGNASSLCTEKTNAAMTLPPLVPCTHSRRCMSHSAGPSDKRSHAGDCAALPAQLPPVRLRLPSCRSGAGRHNAPRDNPLACSAGNCCLAGLPFPQISAQKVVRLLWSCSRGLAPKPASSVAHPSLAGQTSCSLNGAASAASLPHTAATSLVKHCLAACTLDTHVACPRRDPISAVTSSSPLLSSLLSMAKADAAPAPAAAALAAPAPAAPARLTPAAPARPQYHPRSR